LKANASIVPRGWDDTKIPDPDNVLQKFDEKLSFQTSKWRQLRSRLKSLGCKKMKTLIILTDKSQIVREIHLSGLNLVDVPQEIYDFPYLEALYIDNNNIQSISPRIADLKNLKILNAANNKIKNVPKEILKLKSLQILNLANNNLEELPDNIHSFRELRELRLENNKLTDIDLDLKRNHVLCRLFIHGNQLDTEKFSNDMGILKG
jgi:Leucine-rich repeat (LRR) protein